MALIPPQKKDFVEVQSADGRTAFFILNGAVLDLSRPAGQRTNLPTPLQEKRDDSWHCGIVPIASKW